MIDIERKKRLKKVCEQAAVQHESNEGEGASNRVKLCRFWYCATGPMHKHLQRKWKLMHSALEKVQGETEHQDLETILCRFFSMESRYVELANIVDLQKRQIENKGALIIDYEDRIKAINSIRNTKRDNASYCNKANVSLKALGLRQTHQLIQSWCISMIKKFDRILGMETDLKTTSIASLLQVLKRNAKESVCHLGKGSIHETNSSGFQGLSLFSSKNPRLTFSEEIEVTENNN